MKQLLVTLLAVVLLYVGLGAAAASIKFAIKTIIFITRKLF